MRLKQPVEKEEEEVATAGKGREVSDGCALRLDNVAPRVCKSPWCTRGTERRVTYLSNLKLQFRQRGSASCQVEPHDGTGRSPRETAAPPRPAPGLPRPRKLLPDWPFEQDRIGLCSQPAALGGASW